MIGLLFQRRSFWLIKKKKRKEKSVHPVAKVIWGRKTIDQITRKKRFIAYVARQIMFCRGLRMVLTKWNLMIRKGILPGSGWSMQSYFLTYSRLPQTEPLAALYSLRRWWWAGCKVFIGRSPPLAVVLSQRVLIYCQQRQRRRLTVTYTRVSLCRWRDVQQVQKGRNSV